MRDEVLAEWLGYSLLYGYVYVGSMPLVTAVRNGIFICELPLALEAIRYGDKDMDSF